MAIRVIDGVPGGGKSFYAVRHLAKHYFIKDTDGEYYPNPEKPILIITNIDGFKPEHKSLKECIQESGGDHRHFFSEDYQREFTEANKGRNIIYLIDEAQKLFRKNDRQLNEVFSYMEYHRHFGHDIYLITQNVKKLPPDITTLVEYIISATPRVRSLAGEFKYKWHSDGERLKIETVRPSQAIFNLYKSMDSKESEKIKNPVMRTVALVMIGVFLLIGSATYILRQRFGSDKPSSTASAKHAGSASSSFTPKYAGPQAPDPRQPQLHWVELSKVVTEMPNGEVVIYIPFKGVLFPADMFPYEITLRGTHLYAMVPVEAEESDHSSDRTERLEQSEERRGVAM
ncbi:zonular occludens toxin domain-containing protein [Desulfogranum japonicum]|uniref:zonular occludens toxin domain-containing protein n=1 Tax=Desulfogranum japonicum TaxID=231447 RepID=UPI0003FCE88B|nr:zonular occludens toxin domain-containing protein [Desulfogranum japonicum]